ncbi:MAG: ABC transporter permease [Candidatus Hydrogenedentes bacterium]|nr:ABC transporter permease [Candidatus Hydrogenedentota bacterium]
MCGVNVGDPVHHELIKFTGFLARTGTPYDRTIYMPLLTFYGLEGHGEKTAAMAHDAHSREISGAYLKIKRIRGGAIHPAIQDLKYDINKSKVAQLVVPNETLPKLFSIIGWVDKVLAAIAIMVSCLGALFLFVALLSALRERRRDIALMRTLGATRSTVFGMVIIESLVICVAGGLAGIALGHLLVAIGAHFIKIETGVELTAAYVSGMDLALLPSVAVLGVLTGMLPAAQAYRLGILKNLTPIS